MVTWVEGAPNCGQSGWFGFIIFVGWVKALANPHFRRLARGKMAIYNLIYRWNRNISSKQFHSLEATLRYHFHQGTKHIMKINFTEVEGRV